VIGCIREPRGHSHANESNPIQSTDGSGLCSTLVCFAVGPNNYSMPEMLGRTVQSSKRQSPCYSLSGRSKTGRFDEDLRKVSLYRKFIRARQGRRLGEKGERPPQKLGGRDGGAFIPTNIYKISCKLTL